MAKVRFFEKRGQLIHLFGKARIKILEIQIKRMAAYPFCSVRRV